MAIKVKVMRAIKRFMSRRTSAVPITSGQDELKMNKECDDSCCICSQAVVAMAPALPTTSVEVHNKNAMTLPQLPNEMWMEIFKNLQYFDLIRCMRVCKTFRSYLEGKVFDAALFRGKPQENDCDIGQLESQPRSNDVTINYAGISYHPFLLIRDIYWKSHDLRSLDGVHLLHLFEHNGLFSTPLARKQSEPSTLDFKDSDMRNEYITNPPIHFLCLEIFAAHFSLGIFQKHVQLQYPSGITLSDLMTAIESLIQDYTDVYELSYKPLCSGKLSYAATVYNSIEFRDTEYGTRYYQDRSIMTDREDFHWTHKSKMELIIRLALQLHRGDV